MLHYRVRQPLRMLSLHMPIEIFLTWELKIAWDTCEWFVNFVNKFVTLQLVFPDKTLATNLANVRTLTSVNKGVSSEFILVGVGLAANNALERPLTCMDACMNN